MWVASLSEVTEKLWEEGTKQVVHFFRAVGGSKRYSNVTLICIRR